MGNVIVPLPFYTFFTVAANCFRVLPAAPVAFTETKCKVKGDVNKRESPGIMKI